MIPLFLRQLAGHALQDDPRKPDDRVQGRTQFVRHRGDEHGFELVKLLETSVHSFKFVLVFLQTPIRFGQVGGPVFDSLFQFIMRLT